MDVHYVHFSTLDSTNTWAKDHAHELDRNALTCITTDIQTAGRGRLGHRWVSKKGNLHMTLFLPIALTDPCLPNLAQLLSYATAQVLLTYQIPVQIKWPNDLIVEGKKLSGILVETCEQGALLGIGLNINTPVETDQPTTYMASLTKSAIAIQEIRDRVIAYFLKALSMGFTNLVPYFNGLLAFKNEKIRCLCDGKKIEGILLEINEQGHLHLQIGNEDVFVSSGVIEQLRLL